MTSKSAVVRDVVPDDLDSSILEPMRLTHLSQENHTLEWRLSALRAIRSLVNENRDVLLEALRVDLGKSSFEAVLSEVNIVLTEIDTFERRLREWTRPESVSVSAAFFPARGAIRRVPLPSPGVLVLAPFNYPLSLCLLPAIGAIGGGNPVVIKPSETTPALSNALAGLVDRYLAPGVLRVVEGGVDVTTALLRKRWGKVLFTGSTRVGTIVARACAETLTPCVLELGGKCPVFVGRGVTGGVARVAADRLLWGKTLNVGQTCLAPDYLLFERNGREDVRTFVGRLGESLRRMHGATPEERRASLGRVVTERNAKRLIDAIAEVSTESKENHVVLGGVAGCSAEKRYVDPTVVLNPPCDCVLLREEIFGPILVVVEVEDENEAVRFIQSMPGQPLSLYVFSESDAQFDRIIRACPSGSALQNDVLLNHACNALPFGGVGTSGMGAYLGRHSFDTFTHPLTCIHHAFVTPSEILRYPPYDDRKWPALLAAMEHSPNLPSYVSTKRFWFLWTLAAAAAAILWRNLFG